MAEHIPFVTSIETAKIVSSTFSDSELVRLAASQSRSIPRSAKLWVDPAIDGMDDWTKKKSHGNPRWMKYIRSLVHYDALVDQEFWKKPERAVTESFVKSALGNCLQHKPYWITVPQLPLALDSSRNKINRALAAATGAWRSTTNFAGRMILPVVVTNQKMIKNKTARNPNVDQARKCFVDSRADGMWVVETDLDDGSGASNMRDRIGALVKLHEELNQAVPASIRVAGPYWGTNLVLWSRGLVNYPAIGVGGGYMYWTAGGRGSTPSPKVAVGPLRRIAVASELGNWLVHSMERLTASHPAYKEFNQLRGQIALLLDPKAAKRQVATFYKNWYETLSAVPLKGRSMALFQDLSSAFALGKSLPLMERSQPSRKPHAVAEPLMLNCL